jgi:hypothetical protein
MYGGAKFIMFNSNTLEFPNSAPERGWLESQVADLQGAASAIWVTHYDITSPDDVEGGDTKAFYAHLLDQYPVTSLVVHGHLQEHEFSVYHDTPVL